MNETKLVQLTQGAVAKVSEADFEMISQHSWHLTANGYAARTERSTNRRIYMHRVINKAPSGMHVHHIDNDPLNNVRSNLRTLTVSQHRGCARKGEGTSSRFKGVHFRAPRGAGKGTGCWAAHIKHDGKKLHLGHYMSEMDGAWAYNIKAKEVFGDSAELNELPLDFMASKLGPTIFKEKGHSQYRGVSFSKSMQSWFAYVMKDGKRVHTSYHATEQDACIAYNAAAAAHHGPTARLNPL